MKIRTDFVTNSSSYSSAEVVVDNPILLEILMRYKEMGVFGSDNELDFEIGFREASEDPQLKVFSPAPAFYYRESECARYHHPNTLEKVLATIIEFLEDCWFAENYDQDLFSQMKEELLSRKEEINSSYERVSWTGGISSYGSEQPDEGDDNEWRFEYDPEKGESYDVEYYDPKKNPLLDHDET